MQQVDGFTVEIYGFQIEMNERTVKKKCENNLQTNIFIHIIVIIAFHHHYSTQLRECLNCISEYAIYIVRAYFCCWFSCTFSRLYCYCYMTMCSKIICHILNSKANRYYSEFNVGFFCFVSMYNLSIEIDSVQ